MSQHASQLFGQAAVGGRIAPHVPVALGGVAPGPGVEEPGVLVRGVVRDPVERDPHAEVVGVGDQSVELGEVAEGGVDVAVVGNVVAEVGHRRRVDRRQPQRIDAEPAEMAQLRADAGEVADAIAICVGERARVDLVEDCGLPPSIVSGVVGHGFPLVFVRRQLVRSARNGKRDRTSVTMVGSTSATSTVSVFSGASATTWPRGSMIALSPA